MKSAKRHELQTNQLADWIGNHAEGATDYFWPVVGGIVVAFAAAIGIAWYISSQDASAASAWDQYYQAFGEKEREAELKKVADNHPSSAAALWATQSVADINLAKGANLMFSDRAEANNKLKEAEASYQEVLDKARDPFLVTRARYGMAKLKETFCQPEEAQKFYEMVATSEKDSPLGKAAARDAARMKKPETVAFLKWFADQKPRKPVPTGHGGIPGMPPFQVPSDLPERPDISLPGGLNIDSVAPPPAAPGGLDFPKGADAPKDDAPAPGPAPAAPSSDKPGE